ncbi:diacylglycerol kinase family protein [Caproicibacter sp.]|uniref:diacylglycerol kinase family protein n=1 Tax=Caproicibacter sp. TaxID=2814884 RepID=UPI00398A1FF5
MRFLKSFKYAFRGIVYCINNERNMRIHTATALYVFVFSFFFHLTRAEYAVLFLTFAQVVAAELFNTVAEELCDLNAASFNPVVRIVKDMASGGVLVCAVFSVAVGVCLFWKPNVFAQILWYFTQHPILFLLLPLFTAAAVFYIVLGPLGIRDRLRRRKNGNRERFFGGTGK